MDKLRMQTANKADDNFKKLAAMFPNAVTETINENGEVVRAIDKDVLMQEISCKVVDGNEERYQFTWPDKKKSVLLANAPINKTLRPVRENETVPTGADSEGKPYCSTGSVDFDTTENLYIEGDNLEVLKLLQETYLGKIKMIYIDPPYNTGNDFVYNDEFGIRSEEWNGISGNYDADGNQIVGALERNTEANGRFHTDWLNMLYPRLKLAKDLLRDDGVIFISIDDNEVENLKKVCGEVFGEGNFVAIINWKGRGGRQDSKYYAAVHEYISYNTIEGEYDSSIFTAEKATQSFDKAFLAKKAIQDYVFTDGSAEKSIERKFAEDLDAAEEVCVYAKLPRTFQIPTPVGNYSPDWAIAFYEGTVKHIFFVAETKGTMETLELRPIEQAKISCAKKLFNEMSTSHVVYHDVDSYQSLLNIMNSI